MPIKWCFDSENSFLQKVTCHKYIKLPCDIFFMGYLGKNKQIRLIFELILMLRFNKQIFYIYREGQKLRDKGQKLRDLRKICLSHNFHREGPQKMVLVSFDSIFPELSNDTKTIFWGLSW